MNWLEEVMPNEPELDVEEFLEKLMEEIDKLTEEGEWVVLCAAETNPMDGDVYLHDGLTYALMLKMCRDYQGEHITWRDEHNDRLAATQKLRDTEEELMKRLKGV